MLCAYCTSVHIYNDTHTLSNASLTPSIAQYITHTHTPHIYGIYEKSKKKEGRERKNQQQHTMQMLLLLPAITNYNKHY